MIFTIDIFTPLKHFTKDPAFIDLIFSFGFLLELKDEFFSILIKNLQENTVFSCFLTSNNDNNTKYKKIQHSYNNSNVSNSINYEDLFNHNLWSRYYLDFNMMLKIMQCILLENKEFLSIRAIEKAINCPTDTLQKAVNGSQNLPKKWIEPLNQFISNLKKS